MLRIIDLYVIDKIFTLEAMVKVSPMSQMLYINCLIHHFKQTEESAVNLSAFELLTGSSPDKIDYKRFEAPLLQLHKAGLIYINLPVIKFPNMWGKHIDRTKLLPRDPNIAVGILGQQKIDVFIPELLENNEIIETIAYKCRIKPADVIVLRNLFINDQKAVGKLYNNISDATSHFSSWAPKNIALVPASKVNNSRNKIVGYDE